MKAYFLLAPDGSQSEISVCGACGSAARGATNFDISEKCCTCYKCGVAFTESERKVKLRGWVFR